MEIHIERRKIGLLKDARIKKPFEERVIELVDVVATNLWGDFRDRA